MSCSSDEAEYRATANATSEVIWTRNLLKFLGVSMLLTHLYSDNHAALHIANNHVFHERTKHIEVDCHFVCERVVVGHI